MRITLNDLNNIVTLSEAGLSPTRISSILNISEVTIGRYARAVKEIKESKCGALLDGTYLNNNLIQQYCESNSMALPTFVKASDAIDHREADSAKQETESDETRLGIIEQQLSAIVEVLNNILSCIK